ncbi:MAG: response regulator transcription factor [Candidatus Dormibacteraeota bacterium]|uniref:Response regulator transcription factor n=1 Tax=Candidatus Amunia macphersoniae TaxID=3127014 RepID=A0A934KG64_9BACT|nr:response regulator transcription factor [Candidatus Dormibacteraeota bacterium]
MSAAVLIAEDEPMIGLILSQKMTREGHAVVRVATVAGLAGALAACDVALVDVTLDSDGIEAMRGLGTAGARPRAGWFAMVEARDATEGARAVEAGAAGVILKPFKPTAVAAQVTTLLEAVAR